jgi:SPP1 family predicted phage head-tail adaptor
MLAQQLRHRVDIQALVVKRDPETEEAITEDWESVLGSNEELVPAEIRPLSGREFIAAQSVQATVTTKITIRERRDLLPTMRVVHQGEVFNIRAILPDPTLRRYQVLMCESGANDG